MWLPYVHKYVRVKKFNTAPCNATETPPIRDATDGAKLFIQWLYAIHMKPVNKTKLSVKLDNEEIQVYAEDCHWNCFLRPLKQNVPPRQGFEANKSVIRQLIQATNRNNKVCKETNKIQLVEYEWKKESNKVKKDRTKDLHPSIKNMIENASAMERNKPGE